jgi:16S rRNA (guanine966-N2)-methyltransferase
MGLRIIGGFLRGKHLQSVKGGITRPTADRTREAIFNIIASEVQAAFVLDLFAGTGALGIEAVSRGAEHAVFIDNRKSSLSVTEKNIRSCGLEKKTRMIRWDITKNLNCIKYLPYTFQLVFVDPPYRRGMIRPALYHLHQSRSLNSGASIVVEHSAFEPVPEDLPSFVISNRRKYGKTIVSFLSYML